MDLIERLQAATEADRHLDQEIGKAFGVFGDGYINPNLPEFTESVDCAITLLPKGYKKLDIMIIEDGHTYIALPRNGFTEYSIEAATPALAICIAALKAQKQAGLIAQDTGTLR